MYDFKVIVLSLWGKRRVCIYVNPRLLCAIIFKRNIFTWIAFEIIVEWNEECISYCCSQLQQLHSFHNSKQHFSTFIHWCWCNDQKVWFETNHITKTLEKFVSFLHSIEQCDCYWPWKIKITVQHLSVKTLIWTCSFTVGWMAYVIAKRYR